MYHAWLGCKSAKTLNNCEITFDQHNVDFLNAIKYLNPIVVFKVFMVWLWFYFYVIARNPELSDHFLFYALKVVTSDGQTV